MFEKFVAAFMGADLGKLAEFEPLAKHTTLRVGGPVRVFVQPADKACFVEVVRLVREMGLAFKVIGKGSNLLSSDDVFEGVVIQTDKCLTYTHIDGTLVTVGAGVSDVKLARDVAKLNLSGLEFLSGVPGTIGGAVFMNAGAYLREMSDVLVKVQLLNENNELVWLDQDELAMSYRTSIFQQRLDWIVVEAILQLEPGDKNDIMATMKSRKEKRSISQPLEFPSAGSVFRNPDGHSSWQLIEDAGLRGFTIGGAMVSDKHTNFIVNVGGATASDIEAVIRHVKRVVYEKTGIEMHQEVEYFNWSDENGATR